MNQRILKVIRQHPIAISIFALYCVLWSWIGIFIPYHDYTNYGDGETTGITILGAIRLLFVPYLTVLLVLVCYSTFPRFYGTLSWFTIIPVAVAFLWIYIVIALFAK